MATNSPNKGGGRGGSGRGGRGGGGPVILPRAQGRGGRGGAVSLPKSGGGGRGAGQGRGSGGGTNNKQGNAVFKYANLLTFTDNMQLLNSSQLVGHLDSVCPQPKYPSRPGRDPCMNYLRFGDCKFGFGCRFDHAQKGKTPDQMLIETAKKSTDADLYSAVELSVGVLQMMVRFIDRNGKKGSKNLTKVMKDVSHLLICSIDAIFYRARLLLGRRFNSNLARDPTKSIHTATKAQYDLYGMEMYLFQVVFPRVEACLGDFYFPNDITSGEIRENFTKIAELLRNREDLVREKMLNMPKHLAAPQSRGIAKQLHDSFLTHCRSQTSAMRIAATDRDCVLDQMRSALTQHLQAEQAKRFRDWIEVAATPQESAAREVACKEVTLHVSVRAFGSSANTVGTLKSDLDVSVSFDMDPVVGYDPAWLDDPTQALTGCLHAFGLKDVDDEDDEDDYNYSDEDDDLDILAVAVLQDHRQDKEQEQEQEQEVQFDEFGIRVGLDQDKSSISSSSSSSSMLSPKNKAGAGALMKQKQQKQQKQQPLFELKEFVLGARVPLLKMRHVHTEMDIDVILAKDNPFVFLNTQLIREYSSIDARVRPLLFAIKKWASARAVSDSRNSTLSTYCWMLMVIFFLQVGAPVLNADGEVLTIDNLQSKNIDEDGSEGYTLKEQPSLQKIFDKVNGDEECYFPTNTKEGEESNSNSNYDLASLLIQFFTFYGTEGKDSFRMFDSVASVRLGKKIFKNGVGEDATQKKELKRLKAGICFDFLKGKTCSKGNTCTYSHSEELRSSMIADKAANTSSSKSEGAEGVEGADGAGLGEEDKRERGRENENENESLSPTAVDVADASVAVDSVDSVDSVKVEVEIAETETTETIEIVSVVELTKQLLGTSLTSASASAEASAEGGIEETEEEEVFAEMGALTTPTKTKSPKVDEEGEDSDTGIGADIGMVGMAADTDTDTPLVRTPQGMRQRGGSISMTGSAVLSTSVLWRVVIEDPFELQHDLGGVVRSQIGQIHILSELRRACVLLHDYLLGVKNIKDSDISNISSASTTATGEVGVGKGVGVAGLSIGGTVAGAAGGDGGLTRLVNKVSLADSILGASASKSKVTLSSLNNNLSVPIPVQNPVQNKEEEGRGKGNPLSGLEASSVPSEVAGVGVVPAEEELKPINTELEKEKEQEHLGQKLMDLLCEVNTEPPELPFTCHICNMTGHRGADCPNFVCRRCGGQGHFSRNCSKETIQKSRNNGNGNNRKKR